jgi:hypothetical protein
MSPTAQNMKTGPDALGTAENESDNAKHENGTRRTRHRRNRVRERKTLKRDPTTSLLLKMNVGAQNMKTRLDALYTAENESERAKHENRTRRLRNRRKRVRTRKILKQDPTPSVPPKTCPGAQNMKTVTDVLGTAENESGHAKHENRTRRPRYPRK